MECTSSVSSQLVDVYVCVYVGVGGVCLGVWGVRVMGGWVFGCVGSDGVDE